MENLILFSSADLLSRVNLREGELKIGQTAQTIPALSALTDSRARFVLVGIPEDTGIAANYGIRGAKSAWEPALGAFLNMQDNSFLRGSELLALGYFDFKELNGLPDDPANPNALFERVNQMDAQIYPLLQEIFLAGKTPLIVGGGHNNAYPILKGFSLARKQKVNVVNVDAHADLRPTRGRHSGNGFSYALEEGFLKQYLIFGLQQNYITQSMLNLITGNPDISAWYLEDMLEKGNIQACWKNLLEKMTEPCGLEIDLDAISMVLSSASSPTGFALNEVRSLLRSSKRQFSYLHLAEGTAERSDGLKSPYTAKVIAHLLADFISLTPSL